jgi:hypothetical protein
MDSLVSTPTFAIQEQCLSTNLSPSIFVLFYRIIVILKYSGCYETVKFSVMTSESFTDYIACVELSKQGQN